MIMRRRAFVVVCIALLHVLLTMALILLVLGSEMSRWDTGAETPAVIQATGLLLTVLSAPLLPLLEAAGVRPAGFPLDHAVFFLNGLIWGLALVALARAWRARQDFSARAAGSSPAPPAPSAAGSAPPSRRR